jgi:hypothetical protein
MLVKNVMEFLGENFCYWITLQEANTMHKFKWTEAFMIQNNGWYRLKTTTQYFDHLTVSNISFVKEYWPIFCIRLSVISKKNRVIK